MEVIVEDLPNNQESSPEPSQNVDSINHLILTSHFDISSPSKEDENKLRTIYEHGLTLSKTGEPHDVLWQVMNLRRSLGAPRLGESSLDRVYRWSKLKSQQSYIEQELKNV
jgi:hypothetical protein